MGCSAFARRYLRNRFLFIFLRLLRCFNSPGIACPPLCIQGGTAGVGQPGYPIRKSPVHSLSAAHRSLSQLITSFIACWHQGIRHALLTACFSRSLKLSKLVTYRFQPARTALAVWMPGNCIFFYPVCSCQRTVLRIRMMEPAKPRLAWWV